MHAAKGVLEVNGVGKLPKHETGRARESDSDLRSEDGGDGAADARAEL